MRERFAIFRVILAGLCLLLGLTVAFAQEAPVTGAAPPALGGGGGPIPEAVQVAAPAGGAAGNDAFAAGKALQPPHEKAALIRLDAPVDDMMLKSVTRRMDVARKAGCTLVVFEINTFGGLVTSAIEICKLTKKLPAEHMNVVAWVHDKAYSAGALISAACQQIVMATPAKICDCAPIAINSKDELVPLAGYGTGEGGIAGAAGI